MAEKSPDAREQVKKKSSRAQKVEAWNWVSLNCLEGRVITTQKLVMKIQSFERLYFFRTATALNDATPHYHHCVILLLSIGFCIIFDRVMGFDCLLIDARARVAVYQWWCHDIISPKKCLNTAYFFSTKLSRKWGVVLKWTWCFGRQFAIILRLYEKRHLPKIVLHTVSKNLSFLLKFCDRSQAKKRRKIGKLFKKLLCMWSSSLRIPKKVLSFQSSQSLLWQKWL